MEVGQTAVDAGHRQKFAETPAERQQLLQRYCRARYSIYAPAESTPVLQMAMLFLLEDFVGWDELRATKFLLYLQNHTERDVLIDGTLATPAAYLDQKPSARRTLETVAWDVPVSEHYSTH